MLVDHLLINFDGTETNPAAPGAMCILSQCVFRKCSGTVAKQLFWTQTAAMNDLATIPLFSCLDSAVSQRYSAMCRWHSYDTGEMIVDYGEASSELRFILSGRVRLLLRTPDGKEIILAEMAENEFFGEMAAIDKSNRSANVTALEPTAMCIMPAALFNEILREYSQISHEVMKLLCARVRDLNLRLSEHTFMTTRQRLCADLIRLSKKRVGHDGQRIISPPPIHKFLADRIGTQREVVTRELSRLRKKKIVSKSRGGIVIERPDLLNDEIVQH